MHSSVWAVGRPGSLVHCGRSGLWWHRLDRPTLWSLPANTQKARHLRVLAKTNLAGLVASHRAERYRPTLPTTGHPRSPRDVA